VTTDNVSTKRTSVECILRVWMEARPTTRRYVVSIKYMHTTDCISVFIDVYAPASVGEREGHYNDGGVCLSVCRVPSASSIFLAVSSWWAIPVKVKPLLNK